MSEPAPKPLLKWSEMVQWLKANGLKSTEILTHYHAGNIKVQMLPPSRTKYFSVRQIRRDVLDKMEV